jgi:hypothetical protein
VLIVSAFESFWLNVRFHGISIAEKYAGRPINEQRFWACRAFEMWRLGKLEIDYERNELVKSVRRHV